MRNFVKAFLFGLVLVGCTSPKEPTKYDPPPRPSPSPTPQPTPTPQPIPAPVIDPAGYAKWEALTTLTVALASGMSLTEAQVKASLGEVRPVRPEYPSGFRVEGTGKVGHYQVLSSDGKEAIDVYVHYSNGGAVSRIEYG